MVEQVADEVEGLFLGADDGLDVAVELLLARGAQVRGGDVLTGDLTDDIGTGDVHFGLAVHGNDEVGRHGCVHGAAGGLAHHDGDLRAAAAQRHLAAGDLGVHGQRGHRVLNAGAAGVLNTDNWAANLDGHIHDLSDLLAEGHTHGTAVDRLIVRVDAHRTAGDAPVARHHTIRVDGVRVARGLAQGADFHERALVEQRVNALARRGPAGLVAALTRTLGSGILRLLKPRAQIG